MWLWDSNIVRHFGDKHPNLVSYLQQIPWSEIALPSVVVAEILLGRCEFALKATPSQAPLAHQRLWQTQQMLLQFNVIVFDENCANALEALRQQHKTHKCYADLMIAAMAKAGNHLVVTRTLKHFEPLLPKSQMANWIDEKPR
jgi:predicted nucleic acid-binding protein